MTSADAYSLALERLHRQGHLLHSQLWQIVAGDESLMREVRDRLIADGLVIDKLGVALVLTEDRPLDSPLKNVAWTPRPSENELEQDGRGVRPTGFQRTIHNDSPQDDEQGSPHPEGDECFPAGVSTNWTVSDHGSQQIVAATTCAASSEVTIGKASPTLVKPATSSQPVSASPLRYYLWNAGCESGPYPREELEQRLAEGRLQPTDFVRIDSGAEWIPTAKALRRTASSPDATSCSPPDTSLGGSTATAPATRAEELAAAISLAVANNKRASRPPSNPQVSTVSRAAPQVGVRSQTTSENGLARHFGSGQLQNVALVALLGIGVWAYCVWPAAASSIKAELTDYHYELRALHVRNQNPSSPEWRQFVTKHRPRITQLVKTLKPSAIGVRPERDLLYAAERGLLTMFDEGLDGLAEKNSCCTWASLHRHSKGKYSTRSRQPVSSPMAGRMVRHQPVPDHMAQR